nr:aldehyde dehydrogenase family protein [Mycobacterium simiae]
MELGGKNALLVLGDADPGKAATGATRACFSNAGQLCISIERSYVPNMLWDNFVPKFVVTAEKMTLSAALDYSADMGSLINETQLRTVIDHVDDADGISTSPPSCPASKKAWPPTLTKHSDRWCRCIPWTVRTKESPWPTTARSG